MDSAWLVLLTLAFGLAVGVGFTVLFVTASNHSARMAEVGTQDVPDGVDQVLDAMETAAVVLDPSNTVVKVSPGASSLGLVWQRALVHHELVTIVERVRRSHEPFEGEVVLSRGPLGSSSLNVNVRIAPLGVRYVLLVVEDRTEALRLDEVRRDFVANVSHELKTPIGAVSLLAEALDSAADDPIQVRKFASRLTQESARLARLTQEIIELSRLQADDALSDPTLVSIDRILAVAIDQNRVPAEARRIEIASRGAKGVYVYGDEGLLIGAIHNLLSNAVHYSSDGARVGIGARAIDGLVEIAVTDQGIGIADEDLDRVFERFFRVDDARSRHTGGTGLGLSIVKHVVQSHGGDVRVWSRLGQGSTFTILLPEATEARAAALGINFEPELHHSKGKKA